MHMARNNFSPVNVAVPVNRLSRPNVVLKQLFAYLVLPYAKICSNIKCYLVFHSRSVQIVDIKQIKVPMLLTNFNAFGTHIRP